MRNPCVGAGLHWRTAADLAVGRREMITHSVWRRETITHSVWRKEMITHSVWRRKMITHSGGREIITHSYT